MVSVLIPARNEEVNIKRCIYSIDQSIKLRNYYSDDDSSDQTFEIAQELAKKFQFISVVKGEKNQRLDRKTGPVINLVNMQKVTIYYLLMLT